MKKAEMSVETIGKIVLAVFVLLIMVLFVKSIGDWMASLIGFHFEPPPSAEAPTLAVRCAINSVALGTVNEYACVDNVDMVRGVKAIPIKDYNEAVDYIEGLKAIQQQPFYTKLFQLFGGSSDKPKYVGYVFAYKYKYGYNSTIVVCGSRTTLKGVSQSKIDRYFKYLNADDEFKCLVYKFNLPQQTKPIGMNSVLIPSYGDPDFIIYYEKFPDAEAKAWLDVEDSWGTTGILIGGAINAIPVAGKILKTAIRDSASFAFKTVKESALFWRSASKNEIIDGLRDVVIYNVKDSGIVLSEDEASKIAKKIVKGEDEEAISLLTSKGVPEEEASDIVRRWSWMKGLSDEEVKLYFLIERQLDDVLRDEAGNYLGLQSKTLTEFLDKLQTIEDDTAKKSLLVRFFRGDSVELGGKTYQLSQSEINQIREFLDSNLGEFMKTNGRHYETLPRDAKRQYDKKVNELIVPYLKNSRSFRLMMIEGLGHAGFFDPYAIGNIDVDGDGIKDDVFLENVAKCMAVTKGIYGKGFCTVISAVGFSTIWIESKTYYKPVGINTLGLYHPLFFFVLGDSKKYPLVDEAMPYYVYLDRTFDRPSFYLASPCNAVLLVEKTKVTCSVPKCDALEKYRNEYMEYSFIYPYMADYYGCRDANNKCLVTSNYKKAGDKGICYCINEGTINPCYNKNKCDAWVQYYLGCGKISGEYTPYSIYTVSNKQDTSKFMVAGVDYKKYDELKTGLRGYKVCPPPAWYDLGWFSTQYQVNAIKVTPVLSDVEPNYCYWGKGDVSYIIQKIGNDALFIGIDLLVGETPLVIVTGMAYAYFDEQIDKQYRWWNHPDDSIPDWVYTLIPPLNVLRLFGF